MTLPRTISAANSPVPRRRGASTRTGVSVDGSPSPMGRYSVGPQTIVNSGSRRNSAACSASLNGSQRSSASMNATSDDSASDSPRLRLAGRPLFSPEGCRSTRMRPGSSAASSSAVAADESVEPSSTRSNSHAASVCASTDATAPARKRSSFRNGRITDTEGRALPLACTFCVRAGSVAVTCSLRRCSLRRRERSYPPSKPLRNPAVITAASARRLPPWRLPNSRSVAYPEMAWTPARRRAGRCSGWSRYHLLSVAAHVCPHERYWLRSSFPVRRCSWNTIADGS